MAHTQSTEELLERPEVTTLIERGARDGQVSFTQINDLLIDLELDETDIEDILSALESRSIPVVEEAATASDTKKSVKAKKPKESSENSDLDAILSDLESIGKDDDLFSVAQFIAQEDELYAGEDIDDAQKPVDDALKIYLDRMGRVPRLDADSERALAAIAHHGAPDEANKARNDLVESNLRLVVHLAKTAALRTSLSLTDLLQEGNIGLLDAVERYRPDSKKSFGSYATWWIRRAMNRAITDHSRMMKLSGELYKAIEKMQRAQRELSQKLDRSPTREEIAEASGLTIAQIEEAQRAAQAPLSLDLSAGAGEDGADLGEQLTEDDVEVVADAAAKREVASGVNKLLEGLSEREQDVISMRFGLGNYASAGSQSAEDVAKALRLSRDRIHELELRALRKLRSKAKGAGLDKLLSGNDEDEDE